MISGWFIRLVLILALVGAIAFEAFSPQVVKVQLDGVANDAALQARLEWERNNRLTCDSQNPDDTMFQAAQHEADRGHAKVVECGVSDGNVTVTLYRRAKSLVAYRWKKLYKYYDVRVSSSSKRGEGS